MTVILGIKLLDKTDNAVKMQQILSNYNCVIKLRIGINNSSVFCSSTGIILLQIEDKNNAIDIEKALLEISGIELQRMIF